MLKRIAVFEKGQGLCESLAAKCKTKDVEFVEVAAGKKVPPATAAVVADRGAADAAVRAAVEMGERQEGLLSLLADA
ncbi:MAG: hypothetical protein JXR94_06190, partial [Candidatus Hydrogenedentes bacterium]|nr:hypothetical protein [Candidatus Hydrogenedentota bacterium]